MTGVYVQHSERYTYSQLTNKYYSGNTIEVKKSGH